MKYFSCMSVLVVGCAVVYSNGAFLRNSGATQENAPRVLETNEENAFDDVPKVARDLKKRKGSAPVTTTPETKDGTESGKGENHPVCQEIMDSWWSERLDVKTSAAITELDEYCGQFSVEECTQDIDCLWRGKLPGGRCLSNPCQYYNSGSCTVQDTLGHCVWFSKTQVNRINAHFDSLGLDYLKMPGKGCYRNPCDSQGLGTSGKKECKNGEAQYKVPDVYECTWCEGNMMGCQLTQAETDCECERVLSKDEEVQSQVYQFIAAGKCQCSARYPFCEREVSQRDSGYKLKNKK